MTDQFPGLARGPIEHEGSSVLNVIANEQIDMGSSVKLAAAGTNEILPRADQTDSQGENSYGVAVGGDTDGIYGDGSASVDDLTRAAAGAGEAIVVVTQGRAKARVSGASAVGIGDPLTPSATAGVLELAIAADIVVAQALQAVPSGTDIIAVDIQRQGVL